MNANGDEGSFQASHECKYWDWISGGWEHDSFHITMACDIKAQGKIFLRSWNDQGTWSSDPMYFNGKTAAGDYVIQDIPGEFNAGRLTLSADGVLVTEGVRNYMNGYDFTEWNNFPTRPALVSPGQHVLFPVNFRTGNINCEGGLALKGSMSSLGMALCSSSAVPVRFDYSLQQMKPQDIKDMGLPLTVIPCSWQRN